LDINEATNTRGYSHENRPDRTPLHIAALYGHFDLVKYLVSNKADVTITDIEGKTAADVRDLIVRD
jgi:ankyrin repeat protein